MVSRQTAWILSGALAIVTVGAGVAAANSLPATEELGPAVHVTIQSDAPAISDPTGAPAASSDKGEDRADPSESSGPATIVLSSTVSPVSAISPVSAASAPTSD